MTNKQTILVIDDEKTMVALLAKVLRKNGYAVVSSESGRKALEIISSNNIDIVLTDMMMPDIDGMSVLKEVKRMSPSTIVIMMTAFGSVSSAVSAMKEGAYDYISKPFEMEEILITIGKAVEDRLLRQEIALLRDEVKEKYGFENIIGKSKPMLDVFDIIRRVSRSKSTVLIHGKSGTGKELVAKAVHYNSPRAGKHFYALNCSAIPETLLESELFGYVKGAFTGAVTASKGLFEDADESTLFLDEIADISPAMQAKLLRVLQEKEIKRIGDNESIKVDVRLIAATNKNLKEEVRKENFREDLFYRLNVIPIHLPPLRERREDIPLLVEHFLRKYNEDSREVKSISKAAMKQLVNYEWPGNVRELENVIERAVILGTHKQIVPEDLYYSLVQDDEMKFEEPVGLSLKEIEKRYLERVLQLTGGHRVQASKILGIDRRTLTRKVKKYKLNVKKIRHCPKFE